MSSNRDNNTLSPGPDAVVDSPPADKPPAGPRCTVYFTADPGGGADVILRLRKLIPELRSVPIGEIRRMVEDGNPMRVGEYYECFLDDVRRSLSEVSGTIEIEVKSDDD